ncbi:uncharacterized protein LOC124690486 [Lolium rigidum]|uniref:uncharacterized protein LOC124690486 n=1 Tax=Lolium rigidum TaxID=89674 RepID=UPI001F5C55F5|nr:uncharacterized protein LOC124690486 [Lolium rigidum]
MERWTGDLHVPLSRGGPLFRVAASLLLTPSKTLAVRMNVSPVPRANAILFTGDRARGTGDPAIERLSDAAYLAGLLAGKLAGDANAWVVDTACFAGPFAVYRELVPSVDTVGDPERYDPSGLPAAAGVANILTQCIREIQNMVTSGSLKDSKSNQEPTSSILSHSPPRTIILGFSKGGVVVNQLVTELSYWFSISRKSSVDVLQRSTAHLLVPATASDVLSSICEFHYVDVGLNCTGAYITDHDVIKGVANYVCHASNNLFFALHGTPRQWSDPNRPWIWAEKDRMLELLHDEAKRCEGRLLLAEKMYFDGRPRSLLMHFEILEAMYIF